MNLQNKISATYQTIVSLPLIVMDKCHLIQGNVIYTTKSNVQFVARAGTTDIDEIIVIMSGYAYPLSLLPKIKNPVIVDIGAYIGEFSLYAYRFYNAQCKLFAYEPSNENFHYLAINIALNNASFAIYNKGVHIRNGTGYIKTDNLPADQYVVARTPRNATDQPCTVVTLDTILSQNKIKTIDILKIDIEGTEHDLIGDKKTFKNLTRSVRFLFIESHEQSFHRSTATLMHLLADTFDVIEKRDHVFLLKNSTL